MSILSFVDKDQLEPGCSVLLNHKVHAVVSVLGDDIHPVVIELMKFKRGSSRGGISFDNLLENLIKNR